MRRTLALAVATLVFAMRPALASPPGSEKIPLPRLDPPPADGADEKPHVRPYLVHASSEIAGYADSDHVYIVTPSISGRIEDPVAGWSVQGHYLADVISAASVDVISTATPKFHEVRHAGSATASYKPSVVGVAVTLSRSAEPDYFSWAGGASLTYDFDEKNKSLLFGYAYARDEIGRHGTPFDVFSHQLDRHALTGGLTFVLDRSTIAAVVADAVFERGDSSKPYRFIPMFASDVAPTLVAGASVADVNALRLPEKPLEQLPVERDRYALTGRLAHRFEDGVVRLSERIYGDTWGVKASTTDAAYAVDLTSRWSITPHLRFHAQTPATFWKRAYAADFSGGSFSFPALRTGDRELSKLATFTLGNAFGWAIGDDLHPSAWVLTSQLEVMWTHFYDALFIKERAGILLSFGVEAAL